MEFLRSVLSILGFVVGILILLVLWEWWGSDKTLLEVIMLKARVWRLW